jgi:hypothetical protein
MNYLREESDAGPLVGIKDRKLNDEFEDSSCEKALLHKIDAVPDYKYELVQRFLPLCFS